MKCHATMLQCVCTDNARVSLPSGYSLDRYGNPFTAMLERAATLAWVPWSHLVGILTLRVDIRADAIPFGVVLHR